MSDVETLFDSLEALQAEKKLPPVTQWHPERTGRIDIRIARDGTWYHEGSPIRREALVKLFSTVLRRDPDGFCLVTPAEKLLIVVDDAPFVAVDMEVRGHGRGSDILFTTNVDDHVIAGPGHALRVENRGGEPFGEPFGQPFGEPHPCVHVRHGLDALLSRPVFYRLVERAAEEDGELVVYSRGERFPLGRL